MGYPVILDYKYLGVIGTCASNNTPHVEAVKRKCAMIVGNITKIANSQVPPKTKVEIFNAYAKPHITYGLAMTLYRKANMNQLSTIQTKSLKQILNLPTNVNNSKLLYMTGQVPIADLAHIAFLKIYRSLMLYYDRLRVPASTKKIGNELLQIYGYSENDLLTLKFKSVRETLKAKALCRLSNQDYYSTLPIIKLPRI